MSWNAPRTWVNGEVETAAIMNAHIRDNFSLLSTIFQTSTGKILGVTSTYLASRTSTLFSEYASEVAGTNSGVGETTMKTYTLPAGTLAVDGSFVRQTVYGFTTNSANAKIARMKFGATTLLGGSGMFANSVQNNFLGVAHVYRTAAATQKAFAWMVMGAQDTAGNNAYNNITAPTETLANAIAVVLTGQGGASSEFAGYMAVETFLA